MPSLKIKQFGGMLPRIAPENLPENAAQNCIDADLSRGMIEPFRFDLVRFQSAIGKAFYTDGGCFETSPDECATFARVYADCDYLVKADGDGVNVKLWRSDCSGEWCKLGFQLALNAPDVQVVGAAREDFNREARQYYYTLINDKGWESLPSAVSETLIADNDLDVVVSGLLTATPAGVCATAKRIYCAASGLDFGDDKNHEAHFLFIGEVPLDAAVFIHKAHTVYGDVCQSEDNAPPPSDLHSLAYSDNGQLGGLSGDELCLSKPFEPYAFPEQYRYGNFKGKPKRFVVSGNTGYVLTDAYPAIVEMGSTPSEYGCREINIINTHLPIISYRSAATYHGGCVYASHTGLVLLSGGSARVIGLDLWTEAQWAELLPETLRGAIQNGWYFGTTDKISFRLKLPDGIFDTQENYRLTLITSAGDNWQCNDAGKLFFISDHTIKEWSAGDDFKIFYWDSKKFSNSQYAAWSAYKVVANYRDLFVEHSGIKRYAASLYPERILLGSKTINDSRPHRLKAGYATVDLSFTLIGKGQVSEYELASSVSELGER